MPLELAATCALRSDRLSDRHRVPTTPGIPLLPGASSSSVTPSSCRIAAQWRQQPHVMAFCSAAKTDRKRLPHSVIECMYKDAFLLVAEASRQLHLVETDGTRRHERFYPAHVPRM